MKIAAKMMKPSRGNASAWLLVGTGALLVIAANVHLVYVAGISQPACIAHLRASDGGKQNGSFRAAQSSCNPQ